MSCLGSEMTTGELGRDHVPHPTTLSWVAAPESYQALHSVQHGPAGTDPCAYCPCKGSLCLASQRPF